MGNMSYCRFRNTRGDLEDCLEAIDFRCELSEEEYRACKNMFRDFLEFCEKYHIVEVNEEELNMFFEHELVREDEDEEY